MVGVAVRAANAGNAQTWRFVAVEDADLRAAMKQAVDDVLDEMGAWPEAAGLEKELKAYRAYATFFGEAPVVIAVFGRTYHSLADELHERTGPAARRARPAAPAARHPEPRRRHPAALHRGARHGVRLLLDDRARARGAGHRGAARRGAAGCGSRRSSPSAGR